MLDAFRLEDPLWACPTCRALNIHTVFCWECGAERRLPEIPVAPLHTVLATG